MCLGGIVSHVIYKAQRVEYSGQKGMTDETFPMFLPVLNESSDEDNANFDDNSSTEVLFNVLQIGDKTR